MSNKKAAKKVSADAKLRMVIQDATNQLEEKVKEISNLTANLEDCRGELAISQLHFSRFTSAVREVFKDEIQDSGAVLRIIHDVATGRVTNSMIIALLTYFGAFAPEQLLEGFKQVQQDFQLGHLETDLPNPKKQVEEPNVKNPLLVEDPIRIRQILRGSC